MNRVQNKLLEEIQEHERNLTAWERQFINDLDTRQPETLTTNQNHKLNQIHQRVVFDSWR